MSDFLQAMMHLSRSFDEANIIERPKLEMSFRDKREKAYFAVYLQKIFSDLNNGKYLSFDTDKIIEVAGTQIILTVK